jgi:hypothetical protein
MKHRFKKSVIATAVSILAAAASHANATDSRPATEAKSTTSAEAWLGNAEMSAGADTTMTNEAANARAMTNEKRVQSLRASNVSASIDDAPVVMDAFVSSMSPGAFDADVFSSSVRSIKNAPYSAEVIYERVQRLADGNTIEKRSSSATFRDSAGRTRQESRDANGAVIAINIHDAADGTRFTLVPKAKTATKFTLDRDLHKRIAELREKARSIKNRDGTITRMVKSEPGEEIVIKTSESPDGTRRSEEISVNVVRMSGGEKAISTNNKQVIVRSGEKSMADDMLGDLMTTGPIGGTWKDAPYRANATSKSLGTKDIEGIRVTGTQRAYTIPAGEIGNREPITVTTESWQSPELQVTVYSKTSDPRSGETIYRLANVKRTEQPMSLFSVPADYTIKEPKLFNLFGGTK